jgi:hypothetical protein
MTNRTRGFYALLGPFLARREVVAEVGGHMWDDDDKTWFVAVDGKTVVGFCAARPAAKGVTSYLSAYVAPSSRRAGVYRVLWQARRDAFPGPARATCTAGSLPVFLAAGWVATGAKGRFTKVATP